MATVKHAYLRDEDGNQMWVAYVEGTTTPSGATTLLDDFVTNEVGSASAIVIDPTTSIGGVVSSGIPRAFWPFIYHKMPDYMVTAIYIRGIFLGATP